MTIFSLSVHEKTVDMDQTVTPVMYVWYRFNKLLGGE